MMVQQNKYGLPILCNSVIYFPLIHIMFPHLKLLQALGNMTTLGVSFWRKEHAVNHGTVFRPAAFYIGP